MLVKPVYEKVAATENRQHLKNHPMIRNHRIPEIQQMQDLFTAFALLGLVSMGIIAIQRKRKQLMK